MGTCFSKKDSSSASAPAVASTQAPVSAKQTAAVAPRAADSPARKKGPAPQSKQAASEREEDGILKKEVFVIKHRKSHDRGISGHVAGSPASSGPKEKHGAEFDGGCSRDAPEASDNNARADATAALSVGTGIRTSSCTKEEVESILIQCGRLSRNNSSSGKPAAASSCPSSASRSRRYSGSKRSYDFDHPNENDGGRNIASEAGGCNEDERQQHRQSRPSPRHGSRRRTPSRERDQQHSGSTERRRVSRSPGRRSEICSEPAAGAENQKPVKLVSVPATVPSSTEPQSHPSAATVRRISVKRNVGGEGGAGARSAASPRSQSPAIAMEGQGPLPAAPPQSLSRNSSSRKPDQSPHRRNPSFDGDPSRRHEQSPYRRNPLSEIDHNTPSAPIANKIVLPHINGRVQNRNNKENEGLENNLNTTQVIVILYCVFQTFFFHFNLYACFQVVLKTNVVDLGNKKATITTQGTVIMVANPKQETEKLEIGIAEPDNQKQQKMTRSRSGRRSWGNLEFSPEKIQPNPTNSYTNLLLEDIQNFHQTNPAAAASFSLPACVVKAHSIFQAVADLNSNAPAPSSDFSGCALLEGMRAEPSYQLSSNCLKDPIVESEVGVDDDLVEPSMHKYVTLKRGSGVNPTPGDREEIESSGSNSFMGSTGTMQNQWEPGSADSADCWTSSSAPPVGLDEGRRKTNGKRREGGNLGQKVNGSGHGRIQCR
ncbi:hypothetical protein SAY87_000233 [Trapa incisa]|uniref:Uncharacterized protein n=1 Tax=Trapa incisa TaxID=236973 RepID=A0AAN7GMX8_9MYRT|nr:hypothetical protein SAY87_000233 [Trapa incisa]